MCQRAVSDEEAVHQREEPEIQAGVQQQQSDVADDKISCHTVPEVLDDRVVQNLGPCLQEVHRWVRALISSPETGVKFIRKGIKWEWQGRRVDATSFGFIRSPGWLQSIVRFYANIFGFSFFVENHFPEAP